MENKNRSKYLDTNGLIEEECPWLTPSAIRNLVYRRKIPFRKCGGRLVFVRSEIERWVQYSEGMTFDEFKNSKE